MEKEECDPVAVKTTLCESRQTLGETCESHVYANVASRTDICKPVKVENFQRYVEDMQREGSFPAEFEVCILDKKYRGQIVDIARTTSKSAKYKNNIIILFDKL